MCTTFTELFDTIASPMRSEADVAAAYARCYESSSQEDPRWEKVNQIIARRWSQVTLEKIRSKARG